jgi:hypothetical protein
MVEESIDSAAMQLPPGAELIILPNGPRAIETAGTLKLPTGARLVPSTQVLDLVTNWNRCLDAASGALIHLLHEDDAVAPGFYAAIFETIQRYPGAALYATTSQSFHIQPPPNVAEVEPELLEGLDAARFLLLDRRHSCGNVVMTRRALERDGKFLPAFGYSTDEEAYLRFATGGIGLYPAPLYRNRVHPGQVRYPSWLRPEFVEEYVGGRMQGARAFGSEALRIAENSSIERVVSSAVTLALDGYHDESLALLERLEAFIKPRRSHRVAVAKAACRSHAAVRVLRARRRFIAGRSR